MTRDNYWQGVRGLCIICVVLIHCSNGLSFYNQPGLAWNYYFWIIERQIINFPVAVFIFLSGYFIPVDKLSANPKEYLSCRMKKLLPSYLIWTSIYTAITFVHFLKQHQLLPIKTIIEYYCLGQAQVPLYFIVVLIQLTLLTPLLIRCVQSKHLHKLMFAITPLYLLFVYYYQLRYNTLLASSQTFFPAWFGFYYIGLTVRIKGLPKLQRQNSFIYSLAFLLFALGLSLLESYILLQHGISALFVISQIKFSSYLYVLALLNFLFAIKPNKTIFTSKLLINIGNNSFGIFYVHMLILVQIVNKLPIMNEILPLTQLFKVVLIIFLSILTIKIVKKIIGKDTSKICFGF